jgi:glutaredoxin
VYHREVVLYTCRHSLRCWLAKRFLSRQGYPYEVVDTTDTLELVVELSKSVQHKVTLPYLFVDHRPVGSLGVIRALAHSGALSHLIRDDL